MYSVAVELSNPPLSQVLDKTEGPPVLRIQNHKQTFDDCPLFLHSLASEYSLNLLKAFAPSGLCISSALHSLPLPLRIELHPSVAFTYGGSSPLANIQSVVDSIMRPLIQMLRSLLYFICLLHVFPGSAIAFPDNPRLPDVEVLHSPSYPKPDFFEAVAGAGIGGAHRWEIYIQSLRRCLWAAEELHRNLSQQERCFQVDIFLP